jgi:hypothetical protein
MFFLLSGLWRGSGIADVDNVGEDSLFSTVAFPRWLKVPPYLTRNAIFLGYNYFQRLL